MIGLDEVEHKIKENFKNTAINSNIYVTKFWKIFSI